MSSLFTKLYLISVCFGFCYVIISLLRLPRHLLCILSEPDFDLQEIKQRILYYLCSR